MGRSYKIIPCGSAEGVVCLALSGDIDIAAHDALSEAIFAAVRPGVTVVVVDLARVTFFDSGAVGVLLAGRNAARRADCGFQVRNAPELVHRILRTTGIAHLLTDDRFVQPPRTG
ncbi:MAG: STAS domain-containing protein [Micromonosporaceae bacterium]